MELTFTPAVGGWLHADWGDGNVWIRLAMDRHNKLTRISEIHLMDPTPERLRRVPLKRIHAAATMRGAGLLQLMLAAGINETPPPDMFNKPVKGGQKLERRFRLQRPAGKLLDDSFYRDVAHAYQSAIAFGLRPRKAIVADTGAADATVAGWVLEARKRGHLPKGQAGKVTA